jgi:hypothetical protein
MFTIKGKYITFKNGPIELSIFKNLDMNESTKNDINEQLSKTVISDDFKLNYCFESDICIDLTKSLLKFHGRSGDALRVNVEFKVNDDDIKKILTYLMTDFEDSDSDDEGNNENNENVRHKKETNLNSNN